MRRLAIALLVVATLIRPAPAGAAGAVLTLAAAPAQAEPGGQLTLTAAVQDVVALYAFEVHLRFDPARVQVVPTASGKAATPGSVLAPDFVALNRYDNTTGVIDYAVSQVSPSAPVTGTGVLLTVTLAGVGAGPTEVAIDSFILSDIDGMAMPAAASNARLTVGGPPSSVTPPQSSPGSTPEPTTQPTDGAGPAAGTTPGRPLPTASPRVTPPGKPEAAKPAPTGAPVGCPWRCDSPCQTDHFPARRGYARARGRRGGARGGTSASGVQDSAAPADASGESPTRAPSPTPQRVAAAPARPPAQLEPPARLEARAAARQGDSPKWRLWAGIGMLLLAFGLALTLRLTVARAKRDADRPRSLQRG